MMTYSAGRAQLTRFLKNCRARIAPSEAGLPAHSERRRTAGLRREEVAALAGVSVTWYTWLEQGRNIQTSAEVLERLSRTFQLNNDERNYLFELVHHRPPPLKSDGDDELDPAVRRMVSSLNLPSLLVNIRWDILHWNSRAATVFREFGGLPPDRRNLLRYLFTAAEFREDPHEFEKLAHRWLSAVRLDYARSAGDPVFDALIEELSAMCPVFKRAWVDPSSVARSEGVGQVVVPKIGSLTLEHMAYSIEGGSPCMRLLIFTPGNAESAAKLAALGQAGSPKRKPTKVA
jgi:transcriptional regulator with XRE-family HTH domain